MYKKILLSLFIILTLAIVSCIPAKTGTAPEQVPPVVEEKPAPEPSAPAPQPQAPQEEAPVVEEEAPAEEEVEEETVMQAKGCSDSDVTEEFPDGINYGLKGTITIDGEEIISGTDFCNNVVRLSEWSCQSDRPKVVVVECEGSCADGVCSS
tara:strand:+ start:10650 stop:11105 length:456 start_codon:yes stop_codon:yes gene_type:complete